MNEINLMLGDCLDRLKELEDNSVDSIVTDPEYLEIARARIDAVEKTQTLEGFF